jgi:alkaline phosphatase D
MPDRPQSSPSLSRRRFIEGATVVGGGLLADGTLGTIAGRALAASGAAPARAAVGAVPAQVRSGRPVLTDGVQSGDVTETSAVLWARADRPARLVAEVSTTASFRDRRRIRGAVVTPGSDLTGHLQVRGLAPGRPVFYRLSFEDLSDPTLTSEPLSGHFRTAPTRRQDVSFAWSGDTAGQGWGINPDFGGMRIYEAIRQVEPDFFLHSGDNIYADGPILASVPLPDGTTWRNLTTEAKSKVAETLDEFRGNYRYNLMDDNLRRLCAEVPVLAQWDDHETRNNWFPGQILDDRRYIERRVDVLATRSRRAFLEYMPMAEPAGDPEGRIYRTVRRGPLLDVMLLDERTYRGPNSPDDQTAPSRATAFMGERQLAWLEHELERSRATWKLVAADMPLGLVVPDGTNVEAVASGDPRLLGREFEFARRLSFIKRRRIRNVVFVTADVHYTAAHFYDPDKAVFQDFDPFWEFVSGPLNAGTFGPNALDPTFGPQLRFQKVAPTANQPPSAGLQFFGHVTIDAASRAMTVRLKDLSGATLFQVTLGAEGR